MRITVAGRSPSEGGGYDSFAFQQLDAEGHARWAAFADVAAAGEPVPLHAGRYTLLANGRTGTASERASIEIRAGEEARVDLAPRSGRTAMVGAELPAGRPFPARVRTVVRDAAGEVLQECLTCEPFGRRYPHFLQLVPGTYDLEVETSDGQRASGTFTVDLAGAPEPVEFYVPLR